MLEKQMKTTTTKARDSKDPYYDFINSLYWLEHEPGEITPEGFEEAVRSGAKWGFPVGAVKQAGNSAAYRLGWVKNQMQLRGSYFLETEYGEMAEIKGAIPEMREDTVRLNGTSSDIRYRAEFKNQHMNLILEYNASGALSLEQIINVINAGGYVCGIGEWRPERDGSFGKFHIETI